MVVVNANSDLTLHAVWRQNTVRVLYDANGATNIKFNNSNVNYAENVNFNSCVFACLGSSALAYRNAVVNSSIIGNVFWIRC